MIPTNLFPEYGGLAAQGAGHGLGGLLGQVGGVLSAPRRALWSMLGLPESGAEVVGGTENRETPWAQALGMGLEVAGDPLTWLGGPLLRGLGLGAGRAATQAAWQAGPGHAADAEKFATMAGLAGREGVEALRGTTPEGLGRLATQADRADKYPLGALLRNETPENLARLSGELPEGSSFLGSGAEGIAYRTPQGGVVRVQSGRRGLPEARAEAPEMLQPVRNVTLGNTRLEHLPMVNPADAALSGLDARLDVPGLTRAERAGLLDNLYAQGQVANRDRQALVRSAGARGLGEADLLSNPSNLSYTREGQALTHDPGALGWNDTGPLAPSTDLTRPGGRVGALLSTLLGGRGRLRDYLRQGYQSGAVGQGIPV